MSKLDKYKLHFELNKTWREAKKTKWVQKPTSLLKRFWQRIKEML